MNPHRLWPYLNDDVGHAVKNTHDLIEVARHDLHGIRLGAAQPDMLPYRPISTAHREPSVVRDQSGASLGSSNADDVITSGRDADVRCGECLMSNLAQEEGELSVDVVVEEEAHWSQCGYDAVTRVSRTASMSAGSSRG